MLMKSSHNGLSSFPNIDFSVDFVFKLIYNIRHSSFPNKLLSLGGGLLQQPSTVIYNERYL
jgi:hypothetical protein